MNESQFFISAYLMPPRTKQGFIDLKASGINHIYIDYTEKTDIRESALSLCDEYGISAIVMTCWGRADNPFFLRVTEGVEKHKSFVGVNGLDEPVVEDFESIEKEYDAFQKAFPDKTFFVNMVNCGVPHKFIANAEDLDYDDLQKRYEDFVGKMSYGKTVSMTIYPLLHDENRVPYMHPKHLQSLYRLAEMSKKTSAPMYYFIQTMPFRTTHRKPEERDIRFQVSCGLAFGAKGVQYFCYRTPDPNWEFADTQYAMIWKDGRKTDIYHSVKTVNGELQFLAKDYLPLQYEGTATHYSDVPTTHTETFSEYARNSYPLPDEIKSFYSTEDVIVGVFKDGDKKAYYVVGYNEPSQRKNTFVELSIEGVTKVEITVRDKKTVKNKVFDKISFALKDGEGALIRCL